MAEERIHREIVKALSTDPYLVPRGSVCKATLAEWTEFQESENQEVRSSCMEWIAGDVYIVELSTPERGTFLGSFLGDIARQPDAVYRYLKGHSAAYVKARLEGEPQLDPDASYERHRVAFAARHHTL